jgi:hypothetical protein
MNADQQQCIELQWNSERKTFIDTYMLSQPSKDQDDVSLGVFEMSLFQRSVIPKN